MGLNTWIARLAQLAGSVRADYWRARSARNAVGRIPGWRNQPELRAEPLTLRKLEDRRVLSATIQSVLAPTAPVAEGETVEVSAEATATGALSFDWTLTRDSTVIVTGDGQPFAFQAPAEGAYQLSLTATDQQDSGAQSVSQSLVVLRRTQVEDLGATAAGEDRSAVLFGRVDTGFHTGPLTLKIDWGDPLSPGNTEVIDFAQPPAWMKFNSQTGEFSIQHPYLDDNPTATPRDQYTITVELCDAYHTLDTDTTPVEVINLRPRVQGLTTTPIDEGGVTVLSGRINDPGTLDTHTLTINWGDPGRAGNVQTIDLTSPPAGVTFDPVTRAFTVQHHYPEDSAGAEFQVRVTVTDDDGGQSIAHTKVGVQNVSPQLAHVSATDTLEGSQTTLTGQIVDPGVEDPIALTIQWGDGTQETYYYAPGTTSFAETHTYADDNPTGTPADVVTINLSVADDDGGSSSLATNLQVTNVAPTIVGLTATSTRENEKTVLTGRVVDPGVDDTHTLVITWGHAASPGNTQQINLAQPLPPGVMYDPVTGEFAIEHQYLDDAPSGTQADTYPINVSVVDDDTGQGAASTMVQVSNQAPMLVEVVATDVNENGFTKLSGKIVDPGTLDTFTLTVNWADGSVISYTSTPGAAGVDLLNPPPGVTFDPYTRAFTITHQYLDDNPTGTDGDDVEIRLTLVDDDTDMAVDAATIRVHNLPPSIVGLTATAVSENGTTLLTGTILDAGTQDTHQLEINWGDPLSPGNEQTIDLTQPLPAGVTYDAVTGEFAIEHQYRDDNPTSTGSDTYDITVTVADDDLGKQTKGTTVTVTNVDPVIGPTKDVVIDEGGSVSIGVFYLDDPDNRTLPVLSFSDVGVDDTHQATIDWGDGSAALPMTLFQGGGQGALIANPHTYADNGVYTATVTVTDDDGGYDQATFTVTVLNVDPVLTGTAGHQVFEGDPVTLAGLGVGVRDPGFDNPLNTMDPTNGGEVAETFTGVLVDWGDGSPADVVDVVNRVSGSQGVPTTASFSHDAHYYADDGTYTVSVTLRDDDGSNVTHTFEIEVQNVAPTLTLTDDMFVINEGEVLFLPGLGAFTDPGAANPLNPNGPSDETFYYTIDWGDGQTDALQLPVSLVDMGPGVGKAGQLANQHFYADNDADSQYTITVTLHDDDGGIASGQFEITVNNVDPEILALTEPELVDDPYMPGILADGMDLSGDGVTMLVIRYDDPGADTHQVWIDWGDQLDEPAPDERFVLVTPDETVVTPDGVYMKFVYEYTGPPNPADPAAEIKITAVVLDDDYTTVTGDQLVAAPTAQFLVQPGRSNAAVAFISNPGLDAEGVAIDTTPEVAAIEFPSLDEVSLPVVQQAGAGQVLQSQDPPTGGGDQAAVTERAWELRAVTPDGKIGPAAKLRAEDLDDLPSLFAKLKDGRYLILMLRPESNSRRLVLDVYLRNGKPIDLSDDTDGGQDQPPTAEQADLAPAAEELQLDLPGQTGDLQPLRPTLPPEPTTESPTGSLVAGTVATAVVMGRRGAKNYRDQLPSALEQADGLSWKGLAALRRRPK